MTADNPVIEFSSYYQHVVKLYEGDFHGLTWDASLFITCDLWIDLTHATQTAVTAYALLRVMFFSEL